MYERVVREPVLSQRALNRATLARQHLLQRTDLPVLATIAHLVGMQSQLPLNPYLGLWSRLERFDPEVLARLLLDRAVVRIVVIRGTIHLVTADDCLQLRPLVQPVLDRELERHAEHAAALRTLDIAPVIDFIRPVLVEQSRTGAEMRTLIAERFPGIDAAAAAYACRNHLALVQVPPRGVWGLSGAVRLTTAESWLGRPLAAHPSIDDVVLRYFAAYGPASAADVSTWSRLTGMREVVERLRPRLRPFRDHRGRELLDLPDAPRPDPDTPAPPRFLPEYDNLLLSHDDRTRFAAVETTARLSAGARPVRGTVLDDGSVIGTWQIDHDGAGSHLVIDHVGAITKRASSSVAAEGRRMLRFLDGGATQRDVRFERLD